VAATGGDEELAPIESAFHDLFPVAYRVAYRILGNVGDAEDVAAETLARAIVHWPRIGRRSYRAAWVARVSTNVAIDRMRRQQRLAPAPTRPDGDQSDDAVVRVALGAALGSLPRRQREVIVLRYLADLPEAETASLLGVSVNTVKKHTTRGLGALRARLGPTWEEVDLALD
jgi:RNA polymerase sigma factor (sigma-70 family)